MDINLGLTILGIIITIIVGIIGIILSLKNKYKGKLDLIIDNNTDLYDSVVKNIEDLKILYKNKPIEENMYLLKMFLINSGEKDLSKEMIEKNPVIDFGVNSIIHNTKVISKSSDLSIEPKIENNSIIIENGLIRCREYLYFETLVETDKKNPEDIINFNYRISDFEVPKPKTKSNLNTNISILTSVFIGILIGVIPSLFYSNPLKIDKYNLDVEVSTSDKIIELSYFDYYSAYKDNKGIPKTILEEIESKAKYIEEKYNYFDFIFKSKPTEFVINKYKIEFIYQQYLTIIFTFSIVVLLLIILWQYYKNKRNRELFKLLDQVKKGLK